MSKTHGKKLRPTNFLCAKRQLTCVSYRQCGQKETGRNVPQRTAPHDPEAEHVAHGTKDDQDWPEHHVDQAGVFFLFSFIVN